MEKKRKEYGKSCWDKTLKSVDGCRLKVEA